MRKQSKKSIWSETTGITPNSIQSVRTILKKKCEKNILIICTDLTSRNSRHIIDTSLALANYNYKITIITCCTSKRIHSNIKKIDIINLKTRIPISIFGRLEKFFYVLRSAYLGLWATFFSHIQDPVVIICEVDRLALPLLYLNRTKIIYFQYNFTTALINTPVKSTTFGVDLLTRWCLPFSSVILVPNMQYRSIYKRSTSRRLNINVMYPYLSTKSIENQELCSIYTYFPFIPRNSFIFLVLGHYNERSNFELALKAFEHLLLITTEDKIDLLYLLVYGHYSKHNSEERIYFRKIKQMVCSSKRPQQILLLEYTALCEKMSLLYGCTALLHTAIDEIFNKNALEAMFMKKAVIGTRTGFMKEVVKDGVTGFLTEPSIVHLAVAMNKIVVTPKIASIMGNIAHIEFLRRYSFESYGERLKRLVKEYSCDKEKLKNVKYSGSSIESKEIPEMKEINKKFFR